MPPRLSLSRSNFNSRPCVRGDQAEDMKAEHPDFISIHAPV